MVEVERRFALAPDAAAAGVLSSRGYVDLVSVAAAQDEPADAVQDKAEQLRRAFVLADLSARVAAISSFGSGESGGYAGRVLVARAAARVSAVDLDDAQAYHLIAAMFAGGYDRNAMAWAAQIPVGSQAWGLLAVGSPRPLVGVNAGLVDDFSSDDESTDRHRTKFLAAALIGLGRVERADANTLASDYSLGLNTSTRWTQAIDDAADRGEAGTVALLAAVGLQGRGWDGVPAYHIYHITNALRRVGLGADARMIAAEAVTRG